MKDDKLFRQISEEDAARIANEYPTGDKTQRDRIFNEIERRTASEGFASGDEVRGVETYRPRIWMKALSAAAAFILIVGAAAGGAHLLSRNGGTVSPGAEVTEPATEAETAEEATAEATEEETAASEKTPITGDEIIAKMKSRDYDAYDQISIRYHTTTNSGASWEHSIAKRDRLTGNESLYKEWTHTTDYYKDVDPDIIAEWGTTLEELAASVTRNEMFMYKDLYVCVYSDTSIDEPDQYEAYDRSNCYFDKPDVFCNLYSEFILDEGFADSEIQEITENVSYLGRDCTMVRMTSNGKESRPLPPIISSEGEPIAEVQTVGLSTELTLTVDNETGFILRSRLDYETGDYEEFYVEEIRTNEDAELPEDAEYIKERISSCVPNCPDTASYDLSTLDE
jgi:hypothetical protein